MEERDKLFPGPSIADAGPVHIGARTGMAATIPIFGKIMFWRKWISQNMHKIKIVETNLLSCYTTEK